MLMKGGIDKMKSVNLIKTIIHTAYANGEVRNVMCLVRCCNHIAAHFENYFPFIPITTWLYFFKGVLL